MKTLFVTSDWKPDPGGIAELHRSLVSRMPAGSVEVSTVRAPAGWRDTDPFPVRRMPFGFRESSRLQNLGRWAFAARRHAGEMGAGAVQIGTLRPAGSIGLWLSRIAGLPYVVYVHGNDVLKERRKVGRSALDRTTARAILWRAGAIVANSRYTAGLAADLAKAAGAPAAADRVRVVHPGADPARFHPGDEGVLEMRARLGLGRSRVALTVARLEARKGIRRALEAVAALGPEFPDLVYVVIGEGRERAALEARAAAADLRGRVRLPGHLASEELPACYRMAEVFLLPGRRETELDAEGFGISLCEASASAVPVVAGRVGGMPEALREGETGLLVDPGDARELATAVGAVLSNPGLAAQLGQRGRELVLRYLNWDRAAAEAWSIVRGLPAARPRRAARRNAAS